MFNIQIIKLENNLNISGPSHLAKSLREKAAILIGSPEVVPIFIDLRKQIRHNLR